MSREREGEGACVRGAWERVRGASFGGGGVAEGERGVAFAEAGEERVCAQRGVGGVGEACARAEGGVRAREA